MEYGTLEREIYIDAPPTVVYDVVSKPEHVEQWWPDKATYTEATPGSTGEIHFGDKTETFTVMDTDPPRRFTFRWTHPAGEQPRTGNSFEVTFALTPSGDGTLLRMTETGFREMGWEAATLEAMYHDHENGWDHFLPKISPYTRKLTVRP